MKICVLGLGYIGFPTALLLADAGHEVVGVDVNESIVERLNKGIVSDEEPMMLNLHRRASERFHAQTEVPYADAFVICVPTPIDNEMRLADLTYVRSATTMVAARLREGNLVVLESTVPPGTTEKLVVPILQSSGLKPDQFHAGYCSERAIPGNVLHEMVNNDRIVGGKDVQSAAMTKELYSSFVKGSIHLTDLNTAEFIKLMENTYRDVNIALINEFARIAEENNINIWEARTLANKHPRVNLAKPGPGVGGHCIAVDPWFIVDKASYSPLIKTARDVNDSMPNYVIKAIKEMVKDIENPTVTILGVAYKANVSDSRETPALRLIKLAENEGITVKCYDPLVKRFEHDLEPLGDATYNSDCVVLITDHDIFRTIDPRQLSMRTRNLLDTRNSLDHSRWVDAGYSVKILGCPEIMRPTTDISAQRHKEKVFQTINISS
ncbi:MAG: nucleotide sugar dehydrogenase [Methanomassiliicoccus sp.]|nr:nucleotide sugar dehydrogenase [Methanomassiliicoccus sp.]